MLLFELFEQQTTKHAAFAFGRMNPPTVGHAQLINTVAKSAQGGDYFVFVSQSHDAKKNPLDYATKVKFIKALFPDQAGHIVYNPELKTIMQVAEWLYNAGYRSVTFAAGSDRLDSFKKLLTDYNGKEGGNVYYKFDSINFVSSGDRDPDADGIAGVSASSAREAASQGNFEAFAQATGAGKLAQPLYDAVRKGMLLEGRINEFAGVPSGDGGDDRPKLSRIVTVVDKLLNSGNQVDSMLVGARGHVEKADLEQDGFTPNGALLLRKLGIKPSKVGARAMRPFLAKDDDNYEILMVSPKHYKIVDKWEDRTDSLEEDEQQTTDIDSSKIHKLLWSIRQYLDKAMPGVGIRPYEVGTRVWTRGDGTRHRDPARLQFQSVDERDQAFDILSKALTGARATQVSGEFGSDPHQEALVWKGKVIGKYGNNSISLGSATRVSNPNSVWREKPVSECSGYIPKNKKEAKDPRWSNALTVDVHPDTPNKNMKALGLI